MLLFLRLNIFRFMGRCGYRPSTSEAVSPTFSKHRWVNLVLLEFTRLFLIVSPSKGRFLRYKFERLRNFEKSSSWIKCILPPFTYMHLRFFLADEPRKSSSVKFCVFVLVIFKQFAFGSQGNFADVVAALTIPRIKNDMAMLYGVGTYSERINTCIKTFWNITLFLEMTISGVTLSCCMCTIKYCPTLLSPSDIRVFYIKVY